MKKVLLTCFLGLLSFTLLNAQGGIVLDGGGEQVVAVNGVGYAGLNMSSFSGGDAGEQFSIRLGFHAGAGVGLRFLKRHDYAPVAEDGLLGFWGGVALETGGTGEASGKGISMINIGVPLFFQVYPLSWFYIEAGPEFFVNVGNFPKTTTIGSLQVEPGKVKANDAKLGIGVGARRGNLGIGARYLLGMNDFSSSMLWNCNIFQISLSYSIPLSWFGTSGIIL